MSMADIRSSLLKTSAFHETWGHVPTRVELVATLEGEGGACREDVEHEIDALLRDGSLIEYAGRIAFPDAKGKVDEMVQNEVFAPRKRRVAYAAARWLARLSGVRFIALCNTNALGHASDGSDLDFFIVTRAGTIAQTRVLATLPFKLLGRRPSDGDERDTVCLSYFISDNSLDLSSHMLTPDDPYFRYWFLSMVPLFDDGVSQELWDANRMITSRHPLATRWVASPPFEVAMPRARLPSFSLLERLAAKLQEKAFPQAIRDMKNRDTRVLVTEQALKFHVTDGREEYRRDYQLAIERRGIV